MNHLAPSEFVDLAEGTLDPDRAAHASECDACRAQANVVRDALHMIAASGDVPEPSPLFWDHLSARVRDGINAPPRQMFGFGFRGFQPIVAVLALAVVIFSVTLVTRDSRRAVAPGQVATAPGSAGEAVGETEPAPEVTHAEEWAVLTAAAADLQIDEAHAAGMAVQPAAIDRAVQRLTEAELTELGRLLQSELKRSSN